MKINGLRLLTLPTWLVFGASALLRHKKNQVSQYFLSPVKKNILAHLLKTGKNI